MRFRINKLLIFSAGLFLTIATACTSAPTNNDRTPAAQNRPKIWRADDPALKSGDLTVWKLKEMAQAKDFATLEHLFNNGVNLDRLPLGYSAGTGARVMGLRSRIASTMVDTMTGHNWRGKIFFESTDPTKSHGLNRIRRIINTDRVPIVPMAAFKTELLSQHELVPNVTSNFVILNYTHPLTEKYLPERILTKVHVYDIMVAVPGKYGPVYVGKTWLGKYDGQGGFRADNPNELIAWYFLDFNQEAVNEQMSQHWDDSPEEPIDYRLNK